MDYRYSYDCDGLLLAKKASGRTLLSCRYDELGRKISQTDITGRQVNYRFDKSNQLVDICNEFDQSIVSFVRDADGAIQKITHANGMWQDIVYDNAGNRQTRTAKDIKEQYIYDVNNRLTSQIVNGRGENYRYDDAGNLLRDAKNTYEYDAFCRTSKVTTKAGDVQINRYDAEGLRYEMEENGKLVQFIFNENKEVITEETEGNITRLIRTSDLWARESEPEKTWYHYASDEQGSTIFLTDAEGKVKNRYTYDAFGNTIEAEEQIPNRYQYTGQQLDPISNTTCGQDTIIPPSPDSRRKTNIMGMG
jgi:YD repeat-containing protein